MKKTDIDKVVDLIEDGDNYIDGLVKEYSKIFNKSPIENAEFSEHFLEWKKNKENQS